MYMYTAGEFGIVYKGYIVKEQGSIVTDTVAIKTLKGIGLFNFIAIHPLWMTCEENLTPGHN